MLAYERQNWNKLSHNILICDTDQEFRLLNGKFSLPEKSGFWIKQFETT